MAGRVRAKKAKDARAAKFVPQVFEVKGCGTISAGPQDRDHFAEGANGCARCLRFGHQPAHGIEKSFAVRRLIYHQSFQSLGSVETEESALSSGGGEVDTGSLEFTFEGRAMFGSRDDDCGFALDEAGSDEGGQRVYQGLILMIKLNEMLTRAEIARKDFLRRGFHLTFMKRLSTFLNRTFIMARPALKDKG